MNSERKLRSIPPRTMRDVWRQRKGGEISNVNQIKPGGINFGGTRIEEIGQKQPRQTKANQEWIKKHTLRKPIVEKPKSPAVPYENGHIEWETEIIEDYNIRGDLGIILQFVGLDLTQAIFARSTRDYGSDQAVFYAKVGYKGKLPFLILSTNYDIFEAQIVPAKKDLNPLFRKEIFLPQLAEYKAESMTVSQNRGLVIVGYKKR